MLSVNQTGGLSHVERKSGVRVAVCTEAGKLFQMTGPTAAKLLVPSVVLVLGINSNPVPCDTTCMRRNIFQQRLIAFTLHPTKNRSFWRCSSQPIFWLSTKKLNLTQQKQTCIHNKIYYKTNTKTKAWFGHLLQPMAWKWNGPIPKNVNK